MGDENSLVRAKIIIPFFVSIDIISLIIQGIGSGIAATAEIDAKDTMPGGRIVVGGLALQLVGYLIFNVIYINFWIRCQKNPPKSEYWNSECQCPPCPVVPGRDHAANSNSVHVLLSPADRFQFFMAVVFVSSLLIFLRSTFRLAEMAVGWIG